MQTLTAAQSKQINNSTYTHNYSAAAVAEWETTNTDVCSKYTKLFEEQTNVLATAVAHDIGGLIVYFSAANAHSVYFSKTNAKQLVAFYDYENFVGTVFVQQQQQLQAA
jgi:hypothetical protein